MNIYIYVCVKIKRYINKVTERKRERGEKKEK